MEESDSDSTKNQDVDMENEESDSDEDTDSSESDEEVNDEFRTALKSALGNAAVEEDKSDEAEEEEVIINENILFLWHHESFNFWQYFEIWSNICQNIYAQFDHHVDCTFLRSQTDYCFEVCLDCLCFEWLYCWQLLF